MFGRFGEGFHFECYYLLEYLTVTKLQLWWLMDWRWYTKGVSSLRVRDNLIFLEEYYVGCFVFSYPLCLMIPLVRQWLMDIYGSWLLYFLMGHFRLWFILIRILKFPSSFKIVNNNSLCRRSITNFLGTENNWSIFHLAFLLNSWLSNTQIKFSTAAFDFLFFIFLGEKGVQWVQGFGWGFILGR